MKRLAFLLLAIFLISACGSDDKPKTIGVAEQVDSAIAKVLGVTSSTTLTNCNVSDLTVDDEEWAFFDLINAYRAQIGFDQFGQPISQLIMSANLNRAAIWMSGDLGTRTDRVFNHVDSLGRGPATRRLDCGNPTAGYGENIAGGYNSAQQVFNAWKASPGHNANMLTWDAVQIGIARVATPDSPYGVYWTTDKSWVDDGTRVVRGGTIPSPVPPLPTFTPVVGTPTKTPTLIPTPKPTATVKPTATPQKRDCTEGRWGTLQQGPSYGQLTLAECRQRLGLTP